jgi:SAM-dependent methyltransferase
MIKDSFKTIKHSVLPAIRKVLPESVQNRLKFLKKINYFFNSKFHLYAFNSQYEWDKIWSQEKELTWRNYENSFNEISVRIDHNTIILDVGCGLGLLLDKLLQENHCSTIGLDISQVAIDCIIEIGHEGLVSQMPDIPLDDNTVDAICSNELLEYVLEVEKLIENFKRICKPNGKIIIIVPNDKLGPLDISKHYRKSGLLITNYNQVIT